MASCHLVVLISYRLGIAWAILFGDRLLLKGSFQMSKSNLKRHTIYTVLVLENGIPVHHVALERVEDEHIMALTGGVEDLPTALVQEVLQAALSTEGYLRSKDDLKRMIAAAIEASWFDGEAGEGQSPSPNSVDDIPF
jgi:hypothetical protein